MVWPLVAGTAAAGVVSWGVYHPSAQLFGPTVRHTPCENTIALTFDDGPDPEATPRLLDLLDLHGARATFFVLGRRARAYPALVREIAARGHAIGNHTDTHPRLIWHGARTIDLELRRCQSAIADATGIRPVMLRPPFGYRHPQLASVAARVGLRHVVMWSVMTRDWTGRADLVHRRLARVQDRDIVVMHDGSYAGPARYPTADVLPEWLARWRDRGLQTIALSADALSASAPARSPR